MTNNYIIVGSEWMNISFIDANGEVTTKYTIVEEIQG